jgi:hypothetical protein
MKDKTLTETAAAIVNDALALIMSGRYHMAGREVELVQERIEQITGLRDGLMEGTFHLEMGVKDAEPYFDPS